MAFSPGARGSTANPYAAPARHLLKHANARAVLPPIWAAMNRAIEPANVIVARSASCSGLFWAAHGVLNRQSLQNI